MQGVGRTTACDAIKHNTKSIRHQVNIGALHFPHKSGVTVADNIQTTNCHTGVDLKVRITKTMREACLERCKSAHSRD